MKKEYINDNTIELKVTLKGFEDAEIADLLLTPLLNNIEEKENELCNQL